MPETKEPTPTEKVADALRKVSMLLLRDIEEHGTPRITREDLYETLLAIADHLDPPVPPATPESN